VTELPVTKLVLIELPVTILKVTEVKPRVGRPTRPIVCPTFNNVFKNRQEKYKHIKSGKYIVTKAST
jgi:hypothetical protein